MERFFVFLQSDTVTGWAAFWQGVYAVIDKNFIQENRYQWIVGGLKNTIILSLLAGALGIAIGALITFCKLSKIKPLNWIANVYLDIIRGTPSMTQLLVIYFVIFAAIKINPILVGAIAFGVNSGAYVAEIIRAGILSIDKGQTEAGRSLGLTSVQTMRYIIFPQAIKNILPALANEFIVLIKETAIVGYIGVMDLTKGAGVIQSRTFKPTVPLLTSAAIYYVLIKILTILFGMAEKRMRKADVR